MKKSIIAAVFAAALPFSAIAQDSEQPEEICHDVPNAPISVQFCVSSDPESSLAGRINNVDVYLVKGKSRFPDGTEQENCYAPFLKDETGQFQIHEKAVVIGIGMLCVP